MDDLALHSLLAVKPQRMYCDLRKRGRQQFLIFVIKFALRAALWSLMFIYTVIEVRRLYVGIYVPESGVAIAPQNLWQNLTRAVITEILRPV